MSAGGGDTDARSSGSCPVPSGSSQGVRQAGKQASKQAGRQAGSQPVARIISV